MVIHLSDPFYMKLASHLWKSRHGIFYFRIAHQGHDIKRSLGTRDPLLAKGLAYKLCCMSDVDKILARAKSGEIREWKLKADQDSIEIETDGSAEDHARGLEALALAIMSKSAVNPQQSPHAPTQTRIWLLDECIRDYRTERDASIKPRTQQAWDTDFRQLIAGLGATTPVSDIDKDRYAEWRMKSVDKLAPSSQDSKNNVYKNFFAWCIERKRCPENPVTPQKLGKNMRAELQQARGRKRLPYDASDLVKIFDPSLRTQFKKPCLYWMPLLALYTGARAEELAMMPLGGIEEYASGKWQVRFDKSKTTSSVRIIPLHPDIIEAGFLTYIEDVKRLHPKATTPFPYMTAVRGRFTHRFSQDYGAFKTKLGIAAGKDFHSYRTTLIGCLKKNSVEGEIRRAYVGHEHDVIRDEHDKSYGDSTAFSPAEIANAIFSGIDYEKSHQFVMPKRPPYKSGRFDQYLRSALRRPKA